MAPWGGSSGLPKDPAFAADTVIAAPIADAASKFRLEIMIASPGGLHCRAVDSGLSL
jgi:hypothetical protein